MGAPTVGLHATSIRNRTMRLAIPARAPQLRLQEHVLGLLGIPAAVGPADVAEDEESLNGQPGPSGKSRTRYRQLGAYLLARRKNLMRAH